MSTFGDRLRKLRQDREDKPRQEDVATSIGYSRATYANWEIGRGEPDHNALRALSKYFNCSTDYLLGLSELINPQPSLSISKKDDIDELDLVIAASKDGEYGQKASPELRLIIKDIIKEELDKRQKE